MTTLRRALGLALLVSVAASPSLAIQEGPQGASTGDPGAAFQMLSPAVDGQQFTGAAMTRIPFEVPAGRNAMQPNLALMYSSHAGPGPYGTGWDLPIGRIERSLRRGVPKYDSSDVFVVVIPDGVTELVALPDGTYAARIDDGHARITANTGANTWTLHDRSGRDYTFGGAASARTGPASSGFNGTFAWALTQVRDANGNTVSISYLAGTGMAWPQVVTYGANASAGLADVYRVEFAYATRAALAVHLSYGAGFRMDHDRNLTTVTVRLGTTLIRSYDLAWRDSATNGLPLLDRVVLRGTDGATLKLANGHDAATVYAYHEKTSIGHHPPRFQDLGPTFHYFRDETLETLPTADPQTRCARRDFLDMNGDGRPDLVRVGAWSGGNPYWTVNLNQGIGPAQLFDPVAVSWRAPAECLSHRVVDVQGAAVIGTTDKAIIDMNGDARPDFVILAQPSSGPTELRVFLNTGSGFASTYQVWATGIPALREGDGTTGSVYRDLVDLNADGRPEFVRSQTDYTWSVRWNTGSSLAPVVTFTGPTVNIRNGGPDSGAQNITSDLFDVNGDGLPDKVVAGNDAQGDFWKVWLGTGTSTGFLPTVERWTSPKPLIRAWNGDDKTFDYDVFDVTGDGLPDYVDARPDEWRIHRNSGRGFLPMVVWPKPGSIRVRHESEIANALQTDSFDLDGDGYVDHIALPGGGGTVAAIQFADSGGGRTDTLATITVNEGQTVTQIAYAPSARFDTPNVQASLKIAGAPSWVGYLPFSVWAVTEIAASAGAGPTGSQRFRYDGGYFDGGRREFRGFQYAWRTDDYGSTVATQFHQAEPLQGRAVHEWLTARDPAVTGQAGVRQETEFVWGYTIVNGRYVPELASRRVTAHGSAVDVPWNETTVHTVTSALTYDACGNLTREIVTDTAMPAQTLSDNASTFYQHNGGCNAYRVCVGICDRVQTTSQVGGITKTYLYDVRGNITSVQALGPGSPTSTMTYDLAGNLVTLTNPLGAVTRYAYDTAQLRVTAKTEDDTGIALVTDYTYNDKFGKLASVSGPRARTDWVSCSSTAYAYDTFGRLAAVVEPGQTVTQPTRSYVYVLDIPSRVETHTLELEPSPHYVPSVAFYDGAGRPLQTQVKRLLSGPAPVTVVMEAVERTTGGRVTRQFAPRVVTTEPVVFSSTPSSHAATTFTYDEFGRVLTADPPDRRAVTTSRAKLRVTRTCDPRHVVSANEGSCREQEVDGLGRVVSERTYLGNTVSPYATRSLQYDGAGRVVRETQNGNAVTAIVTAYDSLGRKTQVTDPDSGAWTYGYDAAGNVVYLNDPQAGQHVEFTYDRLNRMTGKRRFSADPPGVGTATVIATYSYDTAVCGRGRAASVVDESGSMTFAAYDSRGNALQSTRAITFDGATRRFASQGTFDALGRAKTALYPYPDTDKVETVVFDYSWHGSLARIRSEHGGYLLGVKHDEFGNVTDLSYGNGVHDEAVYYDRSVGFRLRQLTTRLPGQNPLRDVLYRDYDANGNILAVHDQLHNAASPLSLTQLATYDDASRLVRSVQCGAGRYDGTFAHDAYGNLTSKEGAPYGYVGEGPHQASTVAGVPLAYDDNGNVVGLPGDRMLVYDAEGRLVRVDKGGATIATYLYDSSGRRVAAQTPEGAHLFFGAFDWKDGVIIRHFRAGDRLIASSPVNDTGTLLVQAPSSGSMMIARLVGGLPAFGLLGLVFVSRTRRRLGPLRRGSARPVVFFTIAVYLAQLPLLPEAGAQCPPDGTVGTPPVGTIFYHADHVGSPQLLTDEQGRVLEHLVHRPYGAVGGVYDGTSTQIDDPDPPPDPFLATGHRASRSSFLFTSHRADDGTGLVYMGARYYDVALGMFVSHDPARQFASPYTYGAGNPLNGSDPTGAFWEALFFIAFVVLAGVAAGVQASLNGASAGDAVVAGILGAVTAAATYGVGSAVGGAVQASGSVALAVAYKAVAIGYGVYSGYRAIDSGQLATGALSLLSAAVSIGGAAKSSLQSGSGEVASGSAERVGEQLADGPGGSTQPPSAPEDQNFASRVADETWGRFKRDIMDLGGGIYGHLRGIGGGLYKVGVGIGTFNGSLIMAGLYDVGTALVMPRLGSHGGLNYPGTESNEGYVPGSGTKVNNASIRHDRLVGEPGGFSRSSNHFRWIADAWTGSGAEPGLYGQAYRILGTLGFGVAGGGLRAVGY